MPRFRYSDAARILADRLYSGAAGSWIAHGRPVDTDHPLLRRFLRAALVYGRAISPAPGLARAGAPVRTV